ncbi:hypothetical protein PF006_g31925, partial [Phytophthora fragariae]
STFVLDAQLAGAEAAMPSCENEVVAFKIVETSTTMDSTEYPPSFSPLFAFRIALLLARYRMRLEEPGELKVHPEEELHLYTDELFVQDERQVMNGWYMPYRIPAE